MQINLINKLSSSLLFMCIAGFASCSAIQTEDDAIKLNQRGITQMNDGDYDGAIANFKKAIQNSKLDRESNGNIYRNMAIAYHEQNTIDSSMHYSTLAAKCFRKNSYDYLINMAAVDILTGRTEAARTKLIKAASMSPDDLAVNNSLGLIYLGDYGEEFIELDKALTYNKKAFEISRGRATQDILARTYYELAEYKNAELHYENVYNKYPQIAVYALNTGMTKYKLHKISEAEKLFENVLALDSSYRETIDYFKENNNPF